jgi:transposase
LLPKRSAYSAQFKLQVLSHQDREQLSSRQVAAVYDIRNPNQVVVWRRNFDESGMEAFSKGEQRRTNMKSKRRSPAPPSAVITDSTQALREENEQLRAEVAYLKKLQALIRAKRSAAPTKRV